MRPENTVRLRISGNVQGVGYRMWATRTAANLGLRGWVRNRLDGTVEVQATGAPDAVGALIEACRQGPRAARVATVSVSESADDGSCDFTALPTE